VSQFLGRKRLQTIARSLCPAMITTTKVPKRPVQTGKHGVNFPEQCPFFRQLAPVTLAHPTRPASVSAPRELALGEPTRFLTQTLSSVLRPAASTIQLPGQVRYPQPD
jgi:hypothetical protein